MKIFTKISTLFFLILTFLQINLFAQGPPPPPPSPSLVFAATGGENLCGPNDHYYGFLGKIVIKEQLADNFSVSNNNQDSIEFSLPEGLFFSGLTVSSSTGITAGPFNYNIYNSGAFGRISIVFNITAASLTEIDSLVFSDIYVYSNSLQTILGNISRTGGSAQLYGANVADNINYGNINLYETCFEATSVPSLGDLFHTTSGNLIFTSTFTLPIDNSTINTTNFKVYSDQRGYLVDDVNGFINNPQAEQLSFEANFNAKPNEKFSVVYKDLVSSGGQPLKASKNTTFGIGSYVSLVSYANASTSISVDHNLPQSLILDVNNDGVSDIVSYFDVFKKVLLGFGGEDFNYNQASAFGEGDDPSKIVSGDFNSDGFIDFAAACPNSVNVFFNNQSGDFDNVANYFTSGTCNDLVAADFNNDGFFDIVATSAGTNTLNYFQNDGTGIFSSLINIPSNGINVSKIKSGDINIDGNIDIVGISETDGQLVKFHGNGNGTFNCINQAFAGASEGTARELYLGDFTSGFGLEAILSNNAISGKTYHIGFLAYFSDITLVSNTSFLNGVAADLDGNGFSDIVAVNNSASVNVLLSSGSIPFTTQSLAIANTRSVNVLDANNDNRLDLILFSNFGDMAVRFNNTSSLPFQVLNTTPTQNQATVANNTNISLDFNKELDFNFIGNEYEVFGALSGKKFVASSSLNNQNTLVLDPNQNFVTGEDVTVIATSNLKDLSSQNINNPQQFNFRVANGLASGNLVKTVQTNFNSQNNLSDVQCADFNGDGNLDYVTCANGFETPLYVNFGDGLGGIIQSTDRKSVV